jgi:hypothetical protein
MSFKVFELGGEIRELKKICVIAGNCARVCLRERGWNYEGIYLEKRLGRFEV